MHGLSVQQAEHAPEVFCCLVQLRLRCLRLRQLVFKLALGVADLRAIAVHLLAFSAPYKLAEHTAL